MHRRNNVQLGQPGVCNFLFFQHLGNNAVDFTALVENSIGKDAHGALVGTAVDQLDVILDQNAGQLPRGVGIDRTSTRARATIDTDSLHHRGKHRQIRGVLLRLR